MAPIFSGSLPPKKKAELQSIASALDIDTQGTKEELHTRIKKHLDRHAELEEDSQFAGLFVGRRKRSVQPSDSHPPPSKRSADRSPTRRLAALEPLYESTPAKDLRDVSAFLKNPLSPVEGNISSGRRGTRSSLAIVDSPSRVPLPPSPDTSTAIERSVIERSIIEHIPTPRVNAMVKAMQQKQNAAIHTTNKAIFNAREFLSDSRTIWVVTALLELVYIYVTIVPWQQLNIPLSATSAPATSDIPPSTVVPPPASSHTWNIASVNIPYPPLSTFESRMFWTILLHWFMPTVLLPAIAGVLISFRPPVSPPDAPAAITLSASRELSIIREREEDEDEEEEESQQIEVQVEKPKLNIPFDPLTASIIRLAAQVAWPFPSHSAFALTSYTSPTIKAVDVLGFRWRVLSAGVGVAFAFAEAINGSSLLPQHGAATQVSSSRRLLSPHQTLETVVESEVD